MTLVVAYLVAIVAANLVTATFGPAASIVNAFLFIGLDLTARDALHDRWRHDQLVLRMGALIVAGGLISYLLNADAGIIAVASTVAFVLASRRGKWVHMGRVNSLRRMRYAESIGCDSADGTVLKHNPKVDVQAWARHVRANRSLWRTT